MNIFRKLATVQRIKSIEPIEGADRIELAYVLGWQCVVNKGQFKPGDLAVYFEIDSFLPVRPEFEFLRKSSYAASDLLGEGFRLRTMTFRGQISQGLLLPVDTFPDIFEAVEYPIEGDNLTALLSVREWAVQERSTAEGTIIGGRPSFIPYTDEIRIQSNPYLLAGFAGLKYYISTKMDGSSHSVGINETGVHVTSHNVEYKDDGVNKFSGFIHHPDRNYPDKFKAYMDKYGISSLVVQGELCGPAIQDNHLGLNSLEWYVFTVVEDGKRVDLDEMLKLCEECGVKHVPIEEIGDDLPIKYPTVDDLLKRAEGNYEGPKANKKEGIVIRPVTPIQSSLLDNDYLSTKVLNNSFLLKNQD